MKDLHVGKFYISNAGNMRQIIGFDGKRVNYLDHVGNKTDCAFSSFAGFAKREVSVAEFVEFHPKNERYELVTALSSVQDIMKRLKEIQSHRDNMRSVIEDTPTPSEAFKRRSMEYKKAIHGLKETLAILKKLGSTEGG